MRGLIIRFCCVSQLQEVFLATWGREKAQVRTVSYCRGGTYSPALSTRHLLSNCGVDLSACHVDILIDLGLQGHTNERKTRWASATILKKALITNKEIYELLETRSCWSIPGRQTNNNLDIVKKEPMCSSIHILASRSRCYLYIYGMFLFTQQTHLTNKWRTYVFSLKWQISLYGIKLN